MEEITITEEIKSAVKSKTIQLTYPIELEVDGDIKVIDKVTITRLKAKHLEFVPKSLTDGEGGGVDATHRSYRPGPPRSAIRNASCEGRDR